MVLPGPIELDETKVGCERGYMKGVSGWHPIYKWVFGMYCRKTHLTVMQYVANRKKHFLHPIIKKHIAPGNIVITDEHASYLSTLSGNSRLAKLGFFHFFLNHNANEYTHHKFPFISNNLIE